MKGGFISKLVKYALAKKLMNDPDIIQRAENLENIKKNAKDKFDDMEAKGELKRTSELIALRKSLGIDT
jgi:hypothetical protein|tara:strand:- start:627 stop:833 length:207 start_codon:yes stop_codon:yes gene_type:complete